MKKLPIDVDVLIWPDSLTIAGKRNGREVGRLNANLTEGRFLRVVSIMVDKEHRRQGVATQLYTTAARESCREFGVPLASGVQRSDEADAFWRKQMKRGRAARVSTDDGLRYVLSCPAPTSLGQRRR